MSYSITKKIKCYSKVFSSLLQANLLNKHIPFMLEFQVTKACNLTCDYCYADLENLYDKDYSLQQLKDIVDEFYSMGTRVIRILGGEPMVRKDIGEFIRYLRSKDMFIEMATHGQFIPRWVDDLKYLDILQISLDGNEESNDAVRGEGSFKKTIKGLEVAVESGLPVRIHGVFNKISINASKESPVDALARISKEYDIPFNFCQYVLGEDEKDCGANHPAYLPLEETHKFHTELIDYKKKGYQFFNSYDAMKQITNWASPGKDVIYEDQAKDLPSYYNRCQAGEKYCFLDSDGSLYTCVPLWKKGVNIKEEGIRQAWKKLKGVREKEACYSCVSLGDIEFSKTLSLNPVVLKNTFTKVLEMGKYGFTRESKFVEKVR
jgi:MoaA/NifB/PqqE/SkfB family radical SAM enzyme